jgi:hypothetical protein
MITDEDLGGRRTTGRPDRTDARDERSATACRCVASQIDAVRSVLRLPIDSDPKRTNSGGRLRTLEAEEARIIIARVGIMLLMPV